MADIRLVHSRGSRIWLWTGLLAVLGLGLWSTKYFLGDRTEQQNKIGADLGLGSARAPVLPPQAVPLHTIVPLQSRDLGALVHVSGVADSRVRGNAVWVRSRGGRRILVRFEPAPPEEALSGIGPGSSIELDGYLAKISQAEFGVWMDSLGVSVPRPPPGRKFGDLPDPAFARVDSLFVKSFYVSVRPQALQASKDPEDESGGGNS